MASLVLHPGLLNKEVLGIAFNLFPGNQYIVYNLPIDGIFRGA
jgi:hypothetical protein